MKQAKQLALVLIGVIGIILAVGEHVSRRTLEGRMRQATEARTQLEAERAVLLEAQGRLEAELVAERSRTQELAEELVGRDAEIGRIVARLAEEVRTVRVLETNLTSMQQQVEQLEGELSFLMQARNVSGAHEAAGPVHLERVVISGGGPLQGRVLSVDERWDFVVIDLGWEQVKVGDTVSIFRNEELLARARVDRVREAVSVATVLPRWETTEVQVNDVVRIL